MSAPTKFAATFAPPVIPNQLPYDMPQPQVGDTVLWYANASPSVPPLPCAVAKVLHRYCELNPIGTNLITFPERVRHAGDPGLQNPNIRQDGCWDFTPEYYRRREWEAKVEERIAKLGAEWGLKFDGEDAPSATTPETPEEKAERMRQLKAAMEDEGEATEVEEDNES